MGELLEHVTSSSPITFWMLWQWFVTLNKTLLLWQVCFSWVMYSCWIAVDPKATPPYLVPLVAVGGLIAVIFLVGVPSAVFRTRIKLFVKDRRRSNPEQEGELIIFCRESFFECCSCSNSRLSGTECDRRVSSCHPLYNVGLPMTLNTAGVIHYLAITCYFVHDYITVVLNTLLVVRLIVLLISVRL